MATGTTVSGSAAAAKTGHNRLDPVEEERSEKGPAERRASMPVHSGLNRTRLENERRRALPRSASRANS